MGLTLTEWEKLALVAGLQMRICVIETGTPSLRAADIQAGRSGRIRVLDADQRRFVVRLENLIENISNP